MVSTPSQTSGPSGQGEESLGGIGAQLALMARAFIGSPHLKLLIMLMSAILAVILLSAYFQVLLNAWNQPFYNALAKRDFDEFLWQFQVFLALAGALLVLIVSQTFLTLMLGMHLRRGLVEDLLSLWMKPRRAFMLANAGSIGVNPDQRIHEDARHLTELSTTLGIGLLQATIMLVSFVGVLWNISSGFVFQIAGHGLTIPGYMVWAALLYSGSASLLSYFIGRPLVGLNANRYAREADFRFALVRTSEYADAISLNSGEADQERQLRIELNAVLEAMRKLVFATTRLQWVTSSFGWFTIVFPVLVAAPVYFSGNLSFGELMLAVGAFNQVQSALRWFIDNFSLIADWRATLLRVANFRHAMISVEELEHGADHIGHETSEDGSLTLSDVVADTQDGTVALEPADFTVKSGDRVLVLGDNGAERDAMFRVLAGLWPWGRGMVRAPASDHVSYMPRRPYFPYGTLREALAYPRPVEQFENAAFADVLKTMRLDRLVRDLDKKARWDKEVADDDQQKLAFARMLLHGPEIVVSDTALDMLDDDARQTVLEVLQRDMPGTGLVHIAGPKADRGAFSTVYKIVASDDTQARRGSDGAATATGGADS